MSPHRAMRAGSRLAATALATMLLAVALRASAQTVPPVTPPAQRGTSDAERSGTHDAANIRTSFWNYGMVGDYPADPGNVDLSVFHSAEAPKGSGMNYSDGVTPFVLARIQQRSGEFAYIMETGFRERQGTSPYFNRVMRFEPRPGYFEPDPGLNRGRSPAMSHDPRTWPTSWPDKLNDTDDPGWGGSWNGYFGKRPAADQESFTVMDDQYYDAWDYYADPRDESRRGLGLRVEVRGFQWANPQAGNVIFWHYDITNETPTDYDDNIIFGLYMDAGVGGSAVSCDGIFESDDDNAFFDKSLGLNLVYTWDRFGHGKDLSGNCGTTGYLGYAYLETPGNALDVIDNDNDGITDELRDGGPGQLITGQAEILAWVAARYDTAKFRAAYGPIENRPAYRAGVWWTGDEDMDWRADVNDFGADGVPAPEDSTGDTGEGDGIPTQGEANFDRTDLNESDQIGLTGFKMNRIRAGQGNPDPTSDDIVFFTNNANWPERLFTKFSDPNPAARFDSALASNYNIGFLFASGPFKLKAGKTERFSLALAFGSDLTELKETVGTVQLIYNANYQFAVPPPMPTASAETGDGYVRLSWNDVAERGLDPVTNEYDFEGYRIYRSTDPDFLDPRVITTGRGNTFPGNGKPIAQFDLIDGKEGYTRKTIDGVAYWLGTETGITHTWTDTTVTNGQQYYYAVCAYDYGFDTGADSSAIYPSENAIAVSRTLRGGVILPSNVVSVRPEPRVPGFVAAGASAATHVAGEGAGTVGIQVMNSNLVPDGHVFKVTFATPAPDSILATSYSLIDSTDGNAVLFDSGRDFNAEGIGPIAAGLLPIVQTPRQVTVGPASGFLPGSPTNGRLKSNYASITPNNQRRPGYPDRIRIEFDNVVRDTGLVFTGFPARPARFRVFAETATGDKQLDFRFRDVDLNGTLSNVNDRIDILTDVPLVTAVNRDSQLTWSVSIDTVGQGGRGPLVPPALGDVYRLVPVLPLSSNDVFVFSTTGQSVSGDQARAAFSEKPYAVPNPYVGAASFEAAPFAESGRGERRVEFRAVPQNAVVRIYTVRGELVQTLRQDGGMNGMVAWNLRTKDNLDVAPGLYIYHVEGPGVGTAIGKLAILK